CASTFAVWSPRAVRERRPTKGAIAMSQSEDQVRQLQGKVDRLRREMRKVIVGHDALIDETIIALLSGGHVLLEGAPGLGKTRLVRSLGQGLELRFSRIQFTPDLMPADILGTNVLLQDPDRPEER